MKEYTQENNRLKKALKEFKKEMKEGYEVGSVDYYPAAIAQKLYEELKKIEDENR